MDEPAESEPVATGSAATEKTSRRKSTHPAKRLKTSVNTSVAEAPVVCTDLTEVPTEPGELPAVVDEVLAPGNSYYDLGYVASSLDQFNVAEDAWRTKCFSYSFVINSDVELDETTFRTHSRLIFCDGINKSRLLLPSSVSQKAGVPRAVAGTLLFAGASLDAVLALRQFSSKSLGDDGAEEVPPPRLPKRKGGKYFMWMGDKISMALFPKFFPVLSTDQTLYSVSRPVIANGGAVVELLIDVYISESFFEVYGDNTSFSDVPGVSELKKGDKLNYLLNARRPSNYQDNPFLQFIFNERGFEHISTDRKAKIFGDHISPHVLAGLFAHVKMAHGDRGISEQYDPQHRNLKLKLHDYQKRAVSWMYEKEKLVTEIQSTPHPLYFPFETEGGDQLYMQHGTGRISKVLPTVGVGRGGILADEMGLGKTLETISLILCHQKPNSRPIVPHIDLPEERMVKIPIHCYCNSCDAGNQETISCEICGSTYHTDCIGYEYKPESQRFLCSTCQREHPIECKSTLIVAPAAIIGQWKSEISKSTKARTLSVYEYKGISSVGFVSPWEMAKHDIILASYEMLSHEIVYLHAETRKASLRQKSTTRSIIPSPLLAIKFWRFVLDEAQMVESQSSNYSLMALKIFANFYWAVTGTPIQRGVSDLRGLFMFIEKYPWGFQKWFNNYITDPFQAGISEPLQDILADCMWRLEKSDVDNEMGLLPCTTVVHNVQFSGIEKQLYQQVYRDCIKLITSKLRSRKYGIGSDALDLKYTDLDWSLVKIIKLWLAYLEKICNSPTRVKYFFNIMKKATKEEKTEDGLDSLAQVVGALREKAKVALQGSLRAAIMQKNATAGLCWLNGSHANAAEEYRASKRLWKEYEQYVAVDVPQQYHILTNLGELIKQYRAEIPHTLEDDLLLEQAEALKLEFMTKKGSQRDACVQNIKAAWEVWDNETAKIIPHSNIDIEQGIAGVYHIFPFVEKEKETQFLHHVKLSSLSGVSRYHPVRSRALPANYETPDGLKFVLQSRWDDILNDRTAVSKAMKDLIDRTEGTTRGGKEAFVTECAECHLRGNGSITKCQLCYLEKIFNKYEDLIFRTECAGIDDDDDYNPARRYQKRRKFNPAEENERHTLWADGEFELACKSIGQFVRINFNFRDDQNKKLNFALKHPEVDEEFKQFFRTLEMLKKEYKAWKELWINVYDYASSCDELKQAVMRVRFSSPEEIAVLASIKNHQDKKLFRDFRVIVDPGSDLNGKIATARTQFALEQTHLVHDCTHFKYIRNMHDGYVKESEVQARECCVCVEVVGEKWALFPCAHIVCQGCLDSMRAVPRGPLGLTTLAPLPCPMCRAPANNKEIVQSNGIRMRPKLSAESRSFNAVNLKGAPSKTEAIVRTVFELSEDDPEVKILIFSEYTDVLEDYEKILSRNGVASLLVKAKAKIPICIQKLREGTVRILLMPISLGGKGLTIVEATHVFFLEPLLNKGAELQAVGRIHRMGQTKATFVHKFIVEETIEQRIHEMMASVGQEGSLLQQDLTLRQILELLKNSGAHGPDLDSLGDWMQQVSHGPNEPGGDDSDAVVSVNSDGTPTLE